MADLIQTVGVVLATWLALLVALASVLALLVALERWFSEGEDWPR